MYTFAVILLLCLLAVLAGAATITNIARFGETKLKPDRQMGAWNFDNTLNLRRLL